MKTRFLMFFALPVFLLLCSCDKGIGEDEKESREPGVYDLTVSDVGLYNAKFDAKLTLPEQIGTDFELGFELSESNTFPKESTTRYKVENYNPDKTFSCNLSDLEVNVTYYIRAYMINQTCLYTSQVQSFTTTDVKVTTGDVDLETYSVRSQTNVGNDPSRRISYAVRCGINEDFSYIAYHVEFVAETVDEDSCYQVTLDLTSFPYGTMYYQSFVTIDGTAFYGEVRTFEYVYKCPVPEDMNCVDLGLSVKWATCNVGAVSPEEYGDYFAWGETAPKTEYTWLTYKYCKGWCELNKYCNDSSYGYNGYTDTKTVLDPEDDAAHVNWGGDWRMPKKDEFDELINSDNCTWEWTTMNGINGYKVTSKISGYEGNFIFLPDSWYAGSEGCYWSSSLNTDCPNLAWYLYFDSDEHISYDEDRQWGQSVRPVCPVPVTSLNLDKQSVEIMKGETVILTATISYENGGTKNTATWSSSNTSVATVDETGKITAVSTGICTITATLESFSATCNVTVRPSKDDCVDLGLSVKWATCNVGATSPEDYGDYFAWGETEPYYEPDYAQSSSPVWKSGKSEGYSWPSYKYCEGSFMSITKYCDKSEFGYNGYIDRKTVIDQEDDAAHVNWGGDWRMPTENEFNELNNPSNCTWELVTLNGINGYKVTSRKSGYSGNWIFLPIAGYRGGTTLVCPGSWGYYWCGSIPIGGPTDADYEYLIADRHGTASLSRYLGLSVRPVCP